MIKIRIRNADHEIDVQFPISESRPYPVSSSCRSRLCVEPYMIFAKLDCWKLSSDTASMAARVACFIC